MDEVDRLTEGKIPGRLTGIELRKTVCTICDPNSQCGLDCYVKDGRIIKVEGSRENPHSAGTLCCKGAAQRQWVYHEDRLRTPLKRVGPRGSGRMEPVSWTEALNVVADNLARIREESGPEAVVFYCGYPKHPRPFLQRLAMLFGSPNYCTESSVCATATAMAWRLNYGQMAGPDMTRARCLLVWTRNAFYSNTTMARHLMDARDRGVRIIVVDPRKSPIASIADLHLQIRPGTDGALALAMADVMISEGLHDRQFVAEWTHGFDEFRAYASEFSLERAQDITGVSMALIREAAVEYASIKPAAMMSGSAPVVHHTNGVQNQRAVAALVGLTGNFDVPGGNVVQAPSWLHITGAGFTTREHEFELPCAWDDLPPRLGSERFPVWTEMVDEAHSMDLPRQVNTGDPYALRGMVSFGLNHRLWPDSPGMLRALEKLDFICDVDVVMTESAKYADIVLPACSSVERSELRCYPEKYVILTQPVIRPLGESRSDTDIIFGLANKLGLEDPLLSPADGLGGTFLDNGAPDFSLGFEAALDWILEPSGMTVDELGEHPGGMPVPDPSPVAFRKYEEEGLRTPSGKMEFASRLLDRFSDYPGIDALPIYREPDLSPSATPEVAVDYPFILNTGSRLPMFVHSRTFRLPWTRSLRSDAGADISPTDARELGIRQGDLVELRTRSGSIQTRVNVSELVKAGVIHMLHCYPESDVNVLLEGDYLDPISGFPGFKALLCAIRKVDPATRTERG